MYKIIFGLVFLLSVSFAENKSIEGFSSPESVLLVGDYAYVSNVGKELKPMEKDGDGFISKLDKTGKIIELHYIDGLNAPKGSAMIGDILYVADVDTMRGFDLKSKKQVFSLEVPKTKFLNDITSDGKETLYVSSTDLGKIYEIDVTKKTLKEIANLKGVNGLFYDGHNLYAVSLGDHGLHLINAQNNTTKALGKMHGKLDGIQKIGDKIYVSDWVEFGKHGIIKVYDPKTSKESTLPLQKFMAAADFTIDPETMILYMPEMIGGKVTIIDLKNTTEPN